MLLIGFSSSGEMLRKVNKHDSMMFLFDSKTNRHQMRFVLKSFRPEKTIVLPNTAFVPFILGDVHQSVTKGLYTAVCVDPHEMG